ncbi:FAD:protein FMN transferase [Oleisolibacter albus]|uniref:FAD:protein FMN transferase n=1 Tax=Oleisolibacter albus TaxID=2171757 RepID=UPI000DF1A593|nr:FAD:protein FMN transferase [Oleisolibacter albus]
MRTERQGTDRRRFLCISAAAAGLALMPRRAAAAATLHRWDGTALGADASLRLVHPDAGTARRLIDLCLAEVARLEAVFSLYRADSALVRLNRDGRLDDPPADLVRLLGEAGAYARASGGAFDATVQPLWRLYAEHFARDGADPAGPPASAVAAARALVDHSAVQVATDRVRFAHRGMAVTLNGIAQGYITDRVTEILRRAGMTDVLVDMGEIRASGRRPDGRPWQIGLRAPVGGGIGTTLALVDRSVATSGAEGTRFDPAGRFSHLLDPASGRAAPRWTQVTVLAPTATQADALSTALSLLDEPQARRLVDAMPGVGARLTAADGGCLSLGAAA